MIQRLPGPLYRWATWCRRVLHKVLESDRYRASLMFILIMTSVLMLSVPIVPEKLLGIRTPEKVLWDSINGPHNNSTYSGGDEGLSQQLLSDQKIHHVFKRQIPHKFWARARPHNKFIRKKPKSHGHFISEQLLHGDFIGPKH